jgi:hypothetical protein
VKKFLFFFLLPVAVWAQVTGDTPFGSVHNSEGPSRTELGLPVEALPQAPQGPSQTAPPEMGLNKPSQMARASYSYYGGIEYSLYDLVIPNKLGAVAGWQPTASNAYEFEYLRGNFGLPGPLDNFGAVSEERFSILRRSYFNTNSFNLVYGLHYNRFEAHIGGALLNRVSGSGDVSLIQLETWGLTVGLGNRWVIGQRFSVGVDWLTYAQSLFITKNNSQILDATMSSSDKDALESGFKFVRYIPRFSVVKIELGFLF